MSSITATASTVPLHALFQKRIDGDDTLLRLARRRFEQAGLAAEVYAGSIDELDWVLAFTPREARAPMVHLARNVDLLRAQDRATVMAMARRFAGRVCGFVVHDRRELPDRLDDLEAAGAELSAALAEAGPAVLFLEYAAGVQLGQFVEIGARLARFAQLGVCIDIGHVGIREARRHFARSRPDVGVDLADLGPDDPRLAELADDVQAAVAVGVPAVGQLTRALAAQGNRVHYHLHDGHPAIRGLSDHRGFLDRVPVPFSYRGRRSLDPLYGPAGLASILRTAVEAHDPALLSLTLEIHQRDGRLPLGADADLVRHWHDLTNAERMNAWLQILTENARLVTDLQPRRG